MFFVITCFWWIHIFWWKHDFHWKHVFFVKIYLLVKTCFWWNGVFGENMFFGEKIIVGGNICFDETCFLWNRCNFVYWVWALNSTFWETYLSKWHFKQYIFLSLRERRGPTTDTYLTLPTLINIYKKNKSCIQETINLLTCAESTTDTIFCNFMCHVSPAYCHHHLVFCREIHMDSIDTIVLYSALEDT